MTFSVSLSGPTYVFRLAEQLGVLHLDDGVGPAGDGGAGRHSHHLTRHHGVGGLHRRQQGNFTTTLLLNPPGELIPYGLSKRCWHVLQNLEELREPAGLKLHLVTARGQRHNAKCLIGT